MMSTLTKTAPYATTVSLTIAPAMATTAQPGQRPGAPYVPHLRTISLGVYRVSSETWGDWLEYEADVIKHTCDCDAGKNGFRNCRDGQCKHLRIAARFMKVHLRIRAAGQVPQDTPTGRIGQ